MNSLPDGSASIGDLVKTYALYLLPHHALSRIIYFFTRRRSRFTPFAIRRFVKLFDVNMSDAQEPALEHYQTFNEFFTRSLKPSARPIASGEKEIASPADGRISALGSIQASRLFQAKGLDYSLLDLLGGDQLAADRLSNGRFLTVYLSPRDYHRLHMPLTGQLIRQSYIPGRLFSVGPHTVRALPNLFARNERVVAQFETEHGLMALALVGAINVAAIETVWHGLVTPPRQASCEHIDYGNSTAKQSIRLEKGQEMGRFNMGSTIIVLLENSAHWRRDMKSGDAVRMGQFLGKVS